MSYLPRDRTFKKKPFTNKQTKTAEMNKQTNKSDLCGGNKNTFITKTKHNYLIFDHVIHCLAVFDKGAQPGQLSVKNRSLFPSSFSILPTL